MFVLWHRGQYLPLPNLLALEVQVTDESVGTSAILTVKTWTRYNGSNVVPSELELRGLLHQYRPGNDWATSLNPAGILTFVAPSSTGI